MMNPNTALSEDRRYSVLPYACGLFVTGVVAWKIFVAFGNTTAPGASPSAAVLDIGVLVFREGLECVLVLAAVRAGLMVSRPLSRNPIAIGARAGFLATLLSWVVAVRIMDDLGRSVSALALQAATGLIAVIVLLVVMNWFFHKRYWTGWISLHNKRKRELRRFWYMQGIAHLSKNDGFGDFTGLALVDFAQSFRMGLSSFGDWDGTPETFDQVLSSMYGDPRVVAEFKALLDSADALEKKEPPSRPITLENALGLKALCDGYFVTRIRVQIEKRRQEEASWKPPTETEQGELSQSPS